jgi:glycosyltransferase involved in cell wall biosynthesis
MNVESVREREAAIATQRAASLRVLLVTGAYYPEISAAGVQCRSVAAVLGDRVRFSVLTTAVDPSLASNAVVDGVDVHRVNVPQPRSNALASRALRGWVPFARHLVPACRACDLVHLHGFSLKNVPVTALARLLGKPVVLTLHTAGQDEPEVVRRQGGRLASWAFRSADLVLSVSPSLSARYHDAYPAADRARLTPNGIDTRRFRPADRVERMALRRGLGWPETRPIVLFVGFFSRDKRPDLLFQAWRRLVTGGVAATLVYVGAKGSSYYEIDESLARQIRAEAAEMGRLEQVMFIEPTNEIERYLRAADLFALPSAREAHPLALLEAMACGLPSIATRLSGATDVVIEDGVNGWLVPPDDEGLLADRMRDVLTDQTAAWSIGARGRQTVVARYDIERTAEEWLRAYQTVMTDRR